MHAPYSFFIEQATLYNDAIDKSVEVLNDPALLRSFTPEGDDLNVELIEIYGAEVMAR